MKRIALFLLAPVAGGFVAGCADSAPSAVSQAAPTMARIAVKGMHCEACAGSVRGFLKKTPGVAASFVDVASGTVFVKFAPGETVADDVLKKAVYDSGFEATGIARSSDDYAKVVAAYRK